MNKKQSVIAISCILAGLVGFGGVYATEQAAQKRQEEQMAEGDTAEESEQAEAASGVIEPESTAQPQRVIVEDHRTESSVDESVEEVSISDASEESPDLETVDSYIEEPAEEAEENAVQSEPEAEETAAAVYSSETLHFLDVTYPVWPLEGEVLLDYSMDATIYFPTLDQYKYNPAIVIAADEGSAVCVAANGIVTDVSNNEETGCTVTVDLGDGFEAIYGQLEGLTCAAGDELSAGQVIGCVSEPTKYYSVEGSCLYFALRKDGTPVNPLEYFE